MIGSLKKNGDCFLLQVTIELNSKPFVSVTLKPSAVYLGRKISAFNKKIILDIAREKNIPAFQMDIDENSDKYTLKKTFV